MGKTIIIQIIIKTFILRNLVLYISSLQDVYWPAYASLFLFQYIYKICGHKAFGPS